MAAFDLLASGEFGAGPGLGVGWGTAGGGLPAAAGDDELVRFADEAPGTRAGPALPPWRILVVDDDPEVHQATTLALAGELIAGRGLAFLHAHSAQQARALLQRTPEVAVVLLDVVMENEYAGLQLARAIREELGLADTRIVLRTGQPGYAPELQVIRDYDVNDYKTKSELTRTRLVTSITTAVRSYDQLRRINASNAGLQQIVHAAAELASRRELVDFAAAALAHTAALLQVPPAGLVCAQVDERGAGSGGNGDDAAAALRIVWAEGRHSATRGRRAADALPGRTLALLRRCCAERRHQHAADAEGGCGQLALHMAGGGAAAVLLIDLAEAPGATAWQLLAVYCAGLSVGLENVRLFGHLNRLAYTDRLCGLPNRQQLIERIDAAPPAERAGLALLLVDIAQFSQVNDALGPRAGDLLLLAVAERLRQRVPEGLLLARVAGDVFALLGDGARLDPAAVAAAFDEPFRVERYPLPVQATLGEARLAEVAADGLELLKCANIALNRAKTTGARHCVYSRRMAGELRERLRLLSDLHAALEQAQPAALTLHYQAKVDLADGRVHGAEALLRWRDTDGRFVAPEQVVSLAESAGLMVALGDRVMRHACHTARAWREAGHAQFTIAVNVSPSQFHHPDFVAGVQRCLADTGLPPQALELEITETIAVLEMDRVIAVLHALRALGVRIALDDFGTGFSSLAYLHQLPIQTLKIDRSFLRDFPAPPGRASIAELVIRLGCRLGLALVAEGVETEAQADELRRLGCSGAQGYLFAAPLEETAFAALLAQPPRG